jgi:putative chitinase
LADKSDFETITRRINGGLNGFVERLEFYNKAKRLLV